jgi:glycine/D-amino acid oxidase-like deaminating enzyme
MGAWTRSSARWRPRRHSAPGRLVGPAEIKEKFPLIEESLVQGGMWDPDAGLVAPRSQTVAGELVDEGVASGKLQSFANTPAQELIVENGRIKGVKTHRGTIMADHVVVCAGLWGRLIAEMVGEDLPVMPVDHPLTFFGPYTEFEGTGKDIGYPLLRDQGNSAYMRDTGDPKTPRAGRSNGAITRRPIRASAIRATSWKRSRPGCRRRSATSTWNR